MSKSFVHVDPSTREVFRIFATDGLEAKIKFEWAMERISDDRVREYNLGMDPDQWELDEVVDITHEV
jgi:hypothetical protein